MLLDCTPSLSVSSHGSRILLKGSLRVCSGFLLQNFWISVTNLLIPKKYVLLARSIMADGSGKEMMEKENNILIDETRTDLRQGFQRIHSSSSFVPHLSFHLWLLIIRRFQTRLSEIFLLQLFSSKAKNRQLHNVQLKLFLNLEKYCFSMNGLISERAVPGCSTGAGRKEKISINREY